MHMYLTDFYKVINSAKGNKLRSEIHIDLSTMLPLPFIYYV